MAIGFIVLALGSIATFICLICTVVFLVWYLGYFENIDVKVVEKPSPQSIRIFGKKHTGCYTKCAAHFTTVLQDYPKCSTVGVYLDDSNRVEVEKLRYIVGAVIDDGDDKSVSMKNEYEEFNIENLEQSEE